MRASTRDGESSTRAIVFGMTCTARLCSAAPVRAEIVARPAATAVSTPSGDTRTTAGAELFHAIVSSRRSPACEYDAAVSRIRWPATSLVTAGDTVTRAAGPGTMCTSTRSTTGLVPSTRAITLTASVPVEPELIRPVESTFPSNRPPAPKKRIVASGTGWPIESSARATSRSVSPAGIWSEVPGSTSSRAIGEGAVGAGGGGVPCCSAASTRRECMSMGIPDDEGWETQGRPADRGVPGGGLRV